MEHLSIFDILKIGVGPSSSHTLGPWKAALALCRHIESQQILSEINTIHVELYGSLALTGKGHGTDFAIVMGLCGYNPESVNPKIIEQYKNGLEEITEIQLCGKRAIPFSLERNFSFWKEEMLAYHPNGMKLNIIGQEEKKISAHTYFSVGGGFIEEEGVTPQATASPKSVPYPIDSGEDITQWTQKTSLNPARIIFLNERTWRTKTEIEEQLRRLWNTMLNCTFIGCHTEGILPGGLNLVRRAAKINKKLLLNTPTPPDASRWMDTISQRQFNFNQILQWVTCFALGVNEQNASFGRIVTAPTNGAAGVIPSVLLYARLFTDCIRSEQDIFDFLLIAGQVGILYKNGATISAAMGGCQAEIGVSSSMAAAALTHIQGGSPAQSLMAAEIAMEHHLGLTCDPVQGLVQIPCIERNSLGAIKAITASQLAIESDPKDSKVSLDQIIQTMWKTSLDMHHHYKETAQAGLAITLSQPEC